MFKRNDNQLSNAEKSVFIRVKGCLSYCPCLYLRHWGGALGQWGVRSVRYWSIGVLEHRSVIVFAALAETEPVAEPNLPSVLEIEDIAFK